LLAVANPHHLGRDGGPDRGQEQLGSSQASALDPQSADVRKEAPEARIALFE
jgi:hypothetical protein